MPRATTKAVLLASVLAACVIAPAPTHAESFALNEYSATDQGRANAGAAVQTDDASAAFANPALMTLYAQPTLTVALSGVSGASERFYDQGSSDLLGAPLGDHTQDFLVDSLIPALHLVYPVSDRWVLGLAITAPYGLATSYGADWPGRYQALDSELVTINLNPSVAYQLSDKLSLGFGVSAQYSEATLSNAIDFGTVCFGALDPSTCAGLKLAPQTADGHVLIEGNDWSFGYNLGLAWVPSEHWRVGVTYRSEVTHDLKGNANFTAPAAAAILIAGGMFVDTGARAHLELPATIEAGVMWRLSDRTALYASVRERLWSNLQEIRVKFANSVQPDAVEEANYKDATRYAVGLDYELNDQWVVRAGFAYDETPTNRAHRLARIADDSRRYYAVGASWTASETWRVDVSYNRVQINDNEYDRIGDFGDRVRGRFEGAADVVSIGVTRSFRPLD